MSARILVSIPTETADDELAALVTGWGYETARKVLKENPYDLGPLVEESDPQENVVRLTADNPLVDLNLITELADLDRRAVASRSDFLGYDPDGYPWGFDIEMFRAFILSDFFLDDFYKRHHVHILRPAVRCAAGLSLTVDWYHDWQWVNTLLAGLQERGFPLDYSHIVTWWNEIRQ